MGRFDYFSSWVDILDWIGHGRFALWQHVDDEPRQRDRPVEVLRRWQNPANIAGIRQLLSEAGSAVAATILQGLRDRGQRFVTWENHAKVILLNNVAADAWYVVEGSANWTANPRTEQNILINDRGTWEFHAGWLEEMFAKTAPPTTAQTGKPSRTGFSHSPAPGWGYYPFALTARAATRWSHGRPAAMKTKTKPAVWQTNWPT